MKTDKRISLIIGIAIPCLMIVLVAASIYLPGLFSPPPTFDFLYITGDDYYQNRRYGVEQGRLAERQVTHPEHYSPGPARFFIHSVTRNESREISLEEARQLPLDANLKAPDGFEVVYGSRGSGVFPFIFFRNSDYNTMYLKGPHSSIKLNLQVSPDGSYYSNRARFLGWIKR
jgi:hypothetical protein